MFRFSIRDLMLVMLVLAFGVGWWVEHAKALESQRLEKLRHWHVNTLIDQFAEIGGRVQIREGSVTVVYKRQKNIETATLVTYDD